MGIRTPHDVEIQHARQLQVVNVVALAANEPCIFNPFSTVTQAMNFSHVSLPPSFYLRHIERPSQY